MNNKQDVHRKVINSSRQIDINKITIRIRLTKVALDRTIMSNADFTEMSMSHVSVAYLLSMSHVRNLEMAMSHVILSLFESTVTISNVIRRSKKRKYSCPLEYSYGCRNPYL